MNYLMKYPTAVVNNGSKGKGRMGMLFRWLLILFIITPFAGTAQKSLPPPTDQLVNDYARILSRAEADRLTRKLTDYALETSTQIVIVTEESLEGEDAFDYSMRLAQSWGIGTRGNDNGILIYIAEQDRQIRIQTGYGAEGFLPDVMAKRVIDNVLRPAFRAGNYYAGLDRGTQMIMDLGRGEYTADDRSQGGQTKSFPPWIIIVFIIALILVLSAFNGNDDDDDDDGGYWRGGRYDMPQRRRRRRGGVIIFPGGFGGGGGSFGGGGGFGGFGGFGGGGFGGGGAGGSW